MDNKKLYMNHMNIKHIMNTNMKYAVIGSLISPKLPTENNLL